MTRPIGAAGRAARDLARRRLGARPVQLPAGDAPLPLVQAAPGEAPDATPQGGAAEAALPRVGQIAEANERERPAVSAEEVAERVYRLLCQELRLERERLGHG